MSASQEGQGKDEDMQARTEKEGFATWIDVECGLWRRKQSVKSGRVTRWLENCSCRHDISNYGWSRGPPGLVQSSGGTPYGGRLHKERIRWLSPSVIPARKPQK